MLALPLLQNNTNPAAGAQLPHHQPLTLWLPRTWLLAPSRGTPRLAMSSVVPGCVPAGILSSTGPSTVVTLTWGGQDNKQAVVFFMCVGGFYVCFYVCWGVLAPGKSRWTGLLVCRQEVCSVLQAARCSISVVHSSLVRADRTLP